MKINIKNSVIVKKKNMKRVYKKIENILKLRIKMSINIRRNNRNHIDSDLHDMQTNLINEPSGINNNDINDNDLYQEAVLTRRLEWIGFI